MAYEVRCEEGNLVWPILASSEEAEAVCARLKADRPSGEFTATYVIPAADAVRDLIQRIEDFGSLSGGQLKKKYPDCEPLDGFDWLVRHARAVKRLVAA